MKARFLRLRLVRSLLCSVLGALASSGCATAWLASEVTGVDWQQGEISKVEPSGAVEARVSVSARHVPGPAVVPPAEPVAPESPPPPVEPQPGPVEVHQVPAPLPSAQPPPPRPWPEGALALKCDEERRAERERVTRSLFRYDGTWKALTAFMFVAEAAMGTLSLVVGLQKNPKDGGLVGVGSFFALDALGTAILFFHPPEVRHTVSDGKGEWRANGAACPQDLAVRTSTGDFPVAPSGEVPVIGPWMLQTAVATADAALSLSWRGRDLPLAPSLEERCWWSTVSKSPAPFCRSPAREPTPTRVTLPK
jgi:hypothetical protein